MQINKHNSLLLIGLIVLFHLFNNLYWISDDGGQNLGCESICHLERAFEIYNQVTPSEFGYFQSLARIFHYCWLASIRQKVIPPMCSGFSAISVLLAILFNIPFMQIVHLNMLYLILIIVFTYLFGKESGNRQTGLLAAFLVGFYPIIYGLSRKFVPELALIAATTIAYYLLIKSKYFEKTKYTISLGIVCFLGLVIHPLFSVYLTGALIYYCYSILKIKDKQKLHKFINFFICITITALALLLIFKDFREFKSETSAVFKEMHITLTTHSENFIGNADTATSELFLFAKQTDHCPCTQFTDRGMNIRCFSFYPIQLIYFLSPLFVILLLISIFFYFKNRQCKHKIIMFIWCFLPYLILCLLPKKWGRFYSPAIPALALITSSSISSIKKDKVRKLAMGLIIIGGIIQFFVYSYILSPHLRPPLAKVTESLNAHHPRSTNYKTTASKTIETIKNNTTAKDAKIGVFDVIQFSTRFSDLWYNDLTFYFRLLLNVYKKSPPPVNLHWQISSSVLEKEDYDFLVILNTEGKLLTAESLKKYNLIRKYLLEPPGNITVSIYKKRF